MFPLWIAWTYSTFLVVFGGKRNKDGRWRRRWSRQSNSSLAVTKNFMGTSNSCALCVLLNDSLVYIWIPHISLLPVGVSLTKRIHEHLKWPLFILEQTGGREKAERIKKSFPQCLCSILRSALFPSRRVCALHFCHFFWRAIYLLFRSHSSFFFV